jgi:hypothetical protein
MHKAELWRGSFHPTQEMFPSVKEIHRVAQRWGSSHPTQGTRLSAKDIHQAAQWRDSSQPTQEMRPADKDAHKAALLPSRARPVKNIHQETLPEDKSLAQPSEIQRRDQALQAPLGHPQDPADTNFEPGSNREIASSILQSRSRTMYCSIFCFSVFLLR